MRLTPLKSVTSPPKITTKKADLKEIFSKEKGFVVSERLKTRTKNSAGLLLDDSTRITGFLKGVFINGAFLY